MRELDRHDLHWALRLLPKSVLAMMKKYGPNIVVAGGFIRSAVAQERPNDLDLFTPSPELAKVYAQELVGPRGKLIETENAYTISRRPGQRFSVQFIHRWSYGGPLALLDSFDFTIAKAAFWHEPENEHETCCGTTTAPASWQAVCDDRFYSDLAAKRLVYTCPQRNEDAGGSLLRSIKFMMRDGFKMPLDSLGAVIARMAVAVDQDGLGGLCNTTGCTKEKAWGKVLTGLLREVDPLHDAEHIYHLPTLGEESDVA